MKRKRYTEEQIISILKEHESGMPMGELARRHGMLENTIYCWKSKFDGMKLSDAKRLRELERENEQAKEAVGRSRTGQGGAEGVGAAKVMTAAQRRGAVDYLTHRRFSDRDHRLIKSAELS